MTNETLLIWALHHYQMVAWDKATAVAQKHPLFGDCSPEDAAKIHDIAVQMDKLYGLAKAGKIVIHDDPFGVERG